MDQALLPRFSAGGQAQRQEHIRGACSWTHPDLSHHGVAQLWVLTYPAGDGLGWVTGCMLGLMVSSLLSRGPEEAAHRFPTLPSQQGDPLGLGGLSSRQESSLTGLFDSF